MVQQVELEFFTWRRYSHLWKNLTSVFTLRGQSTKKWLKSFGATTAPVDSFDLVVISLQDSSVSAPSRQLPKFCQQLSVVSSSNSPNISFAAKLDELTLRDTSDVQDMCCTALYSILVISENAP